MKIKINTISLKFVKFVYLAQCGYAGPADGDDLLEALSPQILDIVLGIHIFL